MITPTFFTGSVRPTKEELLDSASDLHNIAKRLEMYSSNIKSAWAGPEMDTFSAKMESLVADVYVAATEVFQAAHVVPSDINTGGGTVW